MTLHSGVTRMNRCTQLLLTEHGSSPPSGFRYEYVRVLPISYTIALRRDLFVVPFCVFSLKAPTVRYSGTVRPTGFQSRCIHVKTKRKKGKVCRVRGEREIDRRTNERHRLQTDKHANRTLPVSIISLPFT